MNCPICWDNGIVTTLKMSEWKPELGLDPKMYLLVCPNCDYQMYTTDQRMRAIKAYREAQDINQQPELKGFMNFFG